MALENKFIAMFPFTRS
jgi:protein with PEP-CTERM/exosortase system signal